MKAAVFYGPNDLRLEDVPTPEITDDEVLVKVNLAAVCGTDVRIYLGKKTKGVRTPSIIGHELVGTVAKVGANINDFAVGDRIGINPVIPCGHCYYCQNDMENVCENRTAIGYEYDGGFAEYVRIPKAAIQSNNILNIPEHIPLEDAVIAEPLACCLNGINKANVKMNDVVVIIGGGPIGLLHVQLAKLAGAKIVILSELVGHRREKAKKAGADIVVNPNNKSLDEVILKVTDNLGADVVITAIGVPQLLNEALRLLKKGGTLNLFAGFTEDVLAEIDPNIIHYKEITVNGTSSLTRSYFREALSLIESGRINTEIIMTHGFTLDTIQEAIESVRDGIGMKSVIKID